MRSSVAPRWGACPHPSTCCAGRTCSSSRPKRRAHTAAFAGCASPTPPWRRRSGADMARAVIVTGAFGVLGAAVARKFAGSGARVGLIDRVAAPEWTRRFPAPHRLHAGVDLTDPAAATAAVREFSEEAGGLDVL